MLYMVSKHRLTTLELMGINIILKQNYVCLITNREKYFIVKVIGYSPTFTNMLTQKKEEINLEGNVNQQNLEQKSESSSTLYVMEIMRSLIVELQNFKDDNENIKRTHEENQELNEYYCGIYLRKIDKKNRFEQRKQ